MLSVGMRRVQKDVIVRGCSAIRAIAKGEINYNDYEKSQEEKPMHTFVIETPEDFQNALDRIFKGEI